MVTDNPFQPNLVALDKDDAAQFTEPTIHAKDQPQSFLKRHLHLLVSILVIILSLIILFIIDSNTNTVNLDIASSGLNLKVKYDKSGNEISQDTPVRIRSFNADIGSPNELLYYIDTTATVYDGKLKTEWAIPQDVRNRATYTEICIKDDGQKESVNQYCQAVGGAHSSTLVDPNEAVADNYNKVSCAYYIPARTTGLVSYLSGWYKLNDKQKVGCGPSNSDTNQDSFSDGVSYIQWAFGLENAYGKDGASSVGYIDSYDNGTSIMGAEYIYAGSGLTINRIANGIYISLDRISANPGSYAGSSTDTLTSYSRPAPPNGSNNSTQLSNVKVPIFTIDQYGRITAVSTKTIQVDNEVGNEVVGVTGSTSGLIRSGTGTTADPYTLALSINNNSLKLDNNQLAIVAPTCNNSSTNTTNNSLNTGTNPNDPTNPDQPTNTNTIKQVLNWDGSRFICAIDADTNTNNQQLSLTTNDTTTNNNPQTTYNLSLTGDTTSNVTFTDTNTDDQQLSHSQNTTTANNVTTTTHIISLTGDNPSTIQFIDKDTIYTQAIGSDGLTINNTNHTIAINAPYCENYQKTVWKAANLNNPTASHFECIYTTDRILRGNQTGYDVDVLNNGLTVINNGDGSTTVSITDTGVIAAHYGNPFGQQDTENTTSISFQIPVYTVNAQGQIIQSETQTITKARLGNETTSGLTLIGDGSVDSPYKYNVKVATDGGITTDEDGTKLISCPAGYVLGSLGYDSNGKGLGYDCYHVDELADVSQSYDNGTALDLVASYAPCTTASGIASCLNPCPVDPASYPDGCFEAGGTFNVKYDATKGITITTDGSTGKLAINTGDGITFDGTGKLTVDPASIISTNNNGLTIDGDNNISINVPGTCSNQSTQKLYWTGTAFACNATVNQVTAGTGIRVGTTDGAQGGSFTDTGTLQLADANAYAASNGTTSYGPTANVSGTPAASMSFTVPQVTVDRYGRTTAVTNRTITIPAEVDGIIGNEVTNATTGGGLIRSGAGTAINPYTLGISLSPNGGLKLTGGNLALDIAECATNNYLSWTSTGFSCGTPIDTNTTYTNGNGLTLTPGTPNTFSINAPTCSTGPTANQQTLTWNGTAFLCTSGTDWNLTANNNASTANIADNSTVSFNNGTGLTATRSANNISYALNNTAVTAGSYNSTKNTVTGGFSITVPSFTVNAQGQLTAASTSTIATITGGNGITVNADGTIAVNAPTCNNATTSKLLWTGTAFACGTDTDTDTNTDQQALTWTNATRTLTLTNGGSVVIPDANDNTTYTNGNGLTLSGVNNAFSINASTCPANQYLTWTGTAFACGTPIDTNTDTNTTYTASNGLNLAGTVFTVSAPTCNNATTSKLLWTGTAFSCGTDTDTNTTYTAGTGINISGTTISSTVTDTNTTYTANNGISLAGTVFSINAPTCNNATTSKLLWTGTAFACGTDTDTDTNTDQQQLGWTNATRTLTLTNGGSVVIPDANDNTTYSAIAGGGLTFNGTTIGLISTCTNGQVLKAGTTAGQWACANDNNTDTNTDTTYAAGSGLTLTAGTPNSFSINAPTCTATQRLSWNGTLFQCIANPTDNAGVTSVTASTGLTTGGNGTTGGTITSTGSLQLADSGVTAGTYNASKSNITGGFSLTVPSLTVDRYGRLTAASTSTIVSITGTNGVTVGNDGTISLPGITTGTAACTTTGQGLSWTGTAFSCTTAYSYGWNLQANSTNSTAVLSGNTVNFLAGNGLTVAKGAGNNNVTYAIRLKQNQGLDFDGLGNVGLPNCANGQVLEFIKPSSDSGLWECSDRLANVDNSVTVVNERLFAKHTVFTSHDLLDCTPITPANQRETCYIYGQTAVDYGLVGVGGVIYFKGDDNSSYGLNWGGDPHFDNPPVVTVSYDITGGAYADLCTFSIWDTTTTYFRYDIACPFNTGSSSQYLLNVLNIMAIEPQV
jgi:hypothetical protein